MVERRIWRVLRAVARHTEMSLRYAGYGLFPVCPSEMLEPEEDPHPHPGHAGADVTRLRPAERRAWRDLERSLRKNRAGARSGGTGIIPMTAIRVLVHYREPGDHAGTVAAAYRRAAGTLSGVPGLARFELLSAIDRPRDFTLLMEWESAAMFKVWERELRRNGHTSPLRPYQDRPRPGGHYRVYRTVDLFECITSRTVDSDDMKEVGRTTKRRTGWVAMDFRILGPLWISDGVSEITPSAPKVRQVLALLLVGGCKIVQVTDLIDELWGSEPPGSAMTTLQTYVYKLRKDVLSRCRSARLHTKASGYLLEIPGDQGDLFRFDRLVTGGRAALESGDPAAAREVLGQALALWRGPAFADVTVGGILASHVTRLEEDRLRAIGLRIEADLQLGRHLEVVSELKVLVAGHSLNERFHGYLMVALHRSGRRHEALAAFRDLRRALIDDVGLEPSPWVQRLHEAMLDPGSSLDEIAPAARDVGSDADISGSETLGLPIGVAGEHGHTVAPAQLPPDTPDFTGREAELVWVRRALAEPGGGPIAISGMPGTGKTALAVRAAFLERSGFPGGEFYADLGGLSARPADPGEVLAGFARAAGIPGPDIPAGTAERIGLFWALCESRRVLLMLDDACSAAQLAPLLLAAAGGAADGGGGPGGCAVIITGRCDLRRLPGVRHRELGVMTAREGVELLGRIAGERRITGERAAAAKIVGLCGGHPLALRAAGSRLATMRTWPLAKLVELLEAERGRLDEVHFADLDLRARYDTSYRRLDAGDRGAFRLISLLPPPDFTVARAAA